MLCSDKKAMTLKVGARSSPLAKIQVNEIYAALILCQPYIKFDIHYMTTLGDRDQITSLRTLEKTDFFTRDIDNWILQGDHRIGIHSAKDLPSTLPKGLSILCLTKGIDASDSLVFREGDSLENLKKGALIATSSLRREERVRELRSDLNFCDLRGTIEQRLSKLQNGEVDGVVIAEAAIIRLGLQNLHRIKLSGPTAEGQGQLAVVGRIEDRDIQLLFEPLDVRQMHD